MSTNLMYFEKRVRVPHNIFIKLDGLTLTLKGPLGEVNMHISSYDKNGVYYIKMYKHKGQQELRLRTNNLSLRSTLPSLVSLIRQYFEGLTKGFLLSLELIGIGMRASFVNNRLELRVGYSHPVYPKLPNDVKIFVPHPTLICLFGVSKKRLAQTASTLQALKTIEPYKGKGIQIQGGANLKKTGKKG